MKLRRRCANATVSISRCARVVADSVAVATDALMSVLAADDDERIDAVGLRYVTSAAAM